MCTLTTEDYRQGYRDGWRDATSPTSEPPFLLPPGTHDAMITEIEPRESVSGRDLLRVTLRAEYAGRNNYTVWATPVNNLVFSNSVGKPIYNRLLSDLYYALDIPVEQYTPHRLLTEVGKSLKIVVTHETYRDRTYTQVTGFRPLTAH